MRFIEAPFDLARLAQLLLVANVTAGLQAIFLFDTLPLLVLV